MELVKVVEQNKKYFSEDFIKGFDTGVYRQYQRDKEEKTGKWIETYEGGYKCSVCGDFWGADDEDMIKGFNYCPNCGAKMEE